MHYLFPGSIGIELFRYNNMIRCPKKSFTKKAAEKFIKGQFLSRITKKKTRLYLCPECYTYHLTTTYARIHHESRKTKHIHEGASGYDL